MRFDGWFGTHAEAFNCFGLVSLASFELLTVRGAICLFMSLFIIKACYLAWLFEY